MRTNGGNRKAARSNISGLRRQSEHGGKHVIEATGKNKKCDGVTHHAKTRSLQGGDHANPDNRTRRGGAGANAAAARVTRVPFGHPEGYLEGFANIYAEAARAIRAKRKGGGKLDKDGMCPGIEDGVAGMAFAEACVRSSSKNVKWVKV